MNITAAGDDYLEVSLGDGTTISYKNGNLVIKSDKPITISGDVQLGKPVSVDSAPLPFPERIRRIFR